MLKELYHSTYKLFPIMRAPLYRLEDLYYKFDKKHSSHNEWGTCSVCGQFSRFRYREYINRNSKIAKSCGWDDRFIYEINITNTLECSFCCAKLRLRCAAKSLLKHLWNGKFSSINALTRHTQANNEQWHILETSARYGVLTDFGLRNVTKTEYFDDIQNGGYKDGIRSEDLQTLTFANNSFDAVVSLDVFEHIPDPWQAFSEVHRVLKPGGVGVFTFPLDSRNQKTEQVASLKNKKLEFYREPMYHDDPLRDEGALVFTIYGVDIKEQLEARGHAAFFDIYTTHRTRVNQYVLLLKK